MHLLWHNRLKFNRGQIYFLPTILPLTLALLLGLAVAYLLAQQLWLAAFVLVFLIPAAILFNRYPFLTILLWVVLMPVFPPIDETRYIYWVLHRMLIPLGFGINIVSRMLKIKKHAAIRFTPADILVTIYIAFIFLSIILNQTMQSQFIHFVFEVNDRILIMVMLYWLLRMLNVSEENIVGLVPLLVVICLLEVVVGFISWIAPDLLPVIWIGRAELHGERITGTFSQPEVFTCAQMFFMVFILQYAMTKAKKAWRVILLVVFCLGAASIFFSFSRASWLALVLVFVGLLWIYPKPTFSMLIITIPIMAVLATTIMQREFAWAIERLNTKETVDSRIVLAHAGQQMFLTKPVFGWGFAGYDLYDWQFMEPVDNIVPSSWDREKGTSHNSYLTILAETGVVGFLLYFSPMFWWLWLSIKHFPEIPQNGFWNRNFLILLWFNIAFFLVVTQFVDIRFFRFSIGSVWLSLGLIAVTIERYALSS